MFGTFVKLFTERVSKDLFSTLVIRRVVKCSYPNTGDFVGVRNRCLWRTKSMQMRILGHARDVKLFSLESGLSLLEVQIWTTWMLENLSLNPFCRSYCCLLDKLRITKHSWATFKLSSLYSESRPSWNAQLTRIHSFSIYTLTGENLYPYGFLLS